jgi:hypothetical protein
MTTQLSVNLNAIAQLRNRRDLPWPSVTGLGRIALEAGARGLTVHPRPDERHIRRTDVFELRDMLRAGWPEREYNIEGYPTDEFLALCEAARPDQVTLVPDDPAQSTSDHGWDCARNAELLASVVARMNAHGMRVSLFLDGDPAAVPAAAATGRSGWSSTPAPMATPSIPKVAKRGWTNSSPPPRLQGTPASPSTPGTTSPSTTCRSWWRGSPSSPKSRSATPSPPTRWCSAWRRQSGGIGRRAGRGIEGSGIRNIAYDPSP